MNTKSLAKIAVAAAILIAPIAQAHAYKLTFNSQTGKWSGECVDGHRWIIGNGQTQPTQYQAERICAKHGGMALADEDGKPAGANSKQALKK
ncbi:hypothetical protein [Aerobium aerolatum]|uniref:Uncharacterized protein n=1 Tax=Aquamicrobium aerolatum DSM 21857 TaxID=1121003 RepID=A0A1I3TAI5_9HYPH|nr:hypothetical protein [Aquamicrobium aerolatum]SFJ66507.1 hypothetical protein SAMN03080618_03586 [Aquamicrobium aerolatum DSM 21857]